MAGGGEALVLEDHAQLADAERRPRSRRQVGGDSADLQSAPAAAARSARTEDSITPILLPLLLTAPALALVWSIALRAPTASVASAAVANPGHAIYRVSAVQLYRAYNTNAAATQARIGEHRLLVTGTVVDISKDYLGRDQLLLDVGNSISEAEMTLNADQYGLAVQLQRGQTVAVLCERMQRFTDAPAGSGCTVVEPHLDADPAALTETTGPGVASLNDTAATSATATAEAVAPR